MLICAYAHVSVQVYSHEYAMPMSVYAHVYMYSRMCSYMFTCNPVLICADIHLCVHVCSRVYDMLIFVHASYAYVCTCSHAYMLGLCIHVYVYGCLHTWITCVHVHAYKYSRMSFVCMYTHVCFMIQFALN